MRMSLIIWPIEREKNMLKEFLCVIILVQFLKAPPAHPYNMLMCEILLKCIQPGPSSIQDQCAMFNVLA